SRLKGELLEDVLAGSSPVETLRDRVRYMGEDFDRPHRFVLVRIDSPVDEPVGSDAVIARRETLYNELRAELTRRRLKVHIVNRRNELLLLFPSGPGEQATEPLVRLIQDQAH